MALALPSVTFPTGLAVTGATLSPTSVEEVAGKRGSLERELGKDVPPQYCPAICFTSFWLKGRESQLEVWILSNVVPGDASISA